MFSFVLVRGAALGEFIYSGAKRIHAAGRRNRIYIGACAVVARGGRQQGRYILLCVRFFALAGVQSLKKSLPRLVMVASTEKFLALSRAGRALAEIHLNYEKQEQPSGVEVIGAESGNFAVTKLRLSKDKTELYYNKDITIKNIPARAFEYVVNGRSPLEWIIDRYQIKTDKASQITNNPNDWCAEHNQPRYILDLILSCITVSLKTLEIVENLPEVNFE